MVHLLLVYCKWFPQMHSHVPLSLVCLPWTQAQHWLVSTLLAPLSLCCGSKELGSWCQLMPMFKALMLHKANAFAKTTNFSAFLTRYQLQDYHQKDYDTEYSGCDYYETNLQNILQNLLSSIVLRYDISNEHCVQKASVSSIF